MIKEIIKDTNFLQQKCSIVTKADKNELKEIVENLLETAAAHRETGSCVGLAANQIGYSKRVIAVLVGDKFMACINPTIVRKSKTTHDSEEGCLSLEGTRVVKRFNTVEVLFTDVNGKTQKKIATDFLADIFQHEIDHLNGKLI